MTRRVLSCIYPLIAHKRRVYHETHVYFFEAACRRSIALLCTAVLFTASVFSAPLTADAASPALVILSRYRATLKIGDSFTLAGIASNGKWVRFKSSKSAVASVNTYAESPQKSGHLHDYGKSRRWGSQL